MAVGLHAGTSHLHEDGRATRLAIGFVHGHAHEVAEPGHDHPATGHGGTLALPWFAGTAGWTLAMTAVPPPTSLATPATPPRGAPPDTLFYSHCALRL